MEEKLKTRSEFLIFIKIMLVQLILVVITVAIKFIVGFENQLADDFYQANLEMAACTMLLVAILHFRYYNIYSKSLRVLVTFLIPFIAFFHLYTYLLNALQIKHPSLLNKLFSLQSEILNFSVFTYAIFCFINLIWLINRTNVSKKT